MLIQFVSIAIMTLLLFVDTRMLPKLVNKTLCYMLQALQVLIQLVHKTLCSILEVICYDRRCWTLYLYVDYVLSVNVVLLVQSEDL